MVVIVFSVWVFVLLRLSSYSLLSLCHSRSSPLSIILILVVTVVIVPLEQGETSGGINQSGLTALYSKN